MKTHMIDVQEEKLREAVNKVIELGFSSTACLGASGESIVLYGEHRCSSISVRLHSSGVELLICNHSGEFLFYGKYHPRFGSDFIAKKFKEIIESIGYDCILSDTVEKSNPNK